MNCFSRTISCKILAAAVVIPCLFQQVKAEATDDQASCDPGDDPDPSVFVINGGFLLLILTVVISLWALALVCEDYFVPSLQVLCKRGKVPDSVAGSLIMAAGNNAPEMFVSFLGIFVQKSAIGIGTIIGSEIFNHMCISAGSGYSAKGGVLALNKYQFSRDCFMYALSLVVMMWSTGADFSNTFKEDKWYRCLHVTVLSSGILVLCQLLYCGLVAKFESVLACFGVNEEKLRDTIVRLSENRMSSVRLSEMGGAPRASTLAAGKPPPGGYAGQEDSITGPGDASLSLIPRDTITLYNELVAQEKKMRASMVDSSGTHRVSATVFNVGRGSMTGFRPSVSQGAPNRAPEMTTDAISIESGEGDTAPLTTTEKIIVTFSAVTATVLKPFEVVIEHTLWDVREEANESYYIPNIFICIGWLAFFAYALCECLTILGAWLHIPSVIMGITFSAVGTSFPNLWCSLVVAKNGQGDMAVSNALGSNTFNIFIALGLPWFVFCAANGPYSKLQDGGIIYLTSMLLIVLLIYYAVIAAHDFKIYKSMWMPMIATYFAVIIISIVVH